MIRKVILTGGAGVGKTTIIDLLKLKGYNIVTESGREVYIAEQKKAKGNTDYTLKLPQTDYVAFEEMVILKQIEKENNLDEGIHFLDRSLVDCLGMSLYQKQPLKTDISDLISLANYDTYVYLLSPLEKYENDDQRKETEEEMRRMHEKLREAYLSQGFKIIDVPAISPEERVEFILKNLHQKSS